MALSYGFIETQGLVGSIEAADAMLKAAKVRLVQEREIGFGLVTVIVEGELGAVQAAVDAGRVAAERVGQFITAHVIARPFSDTEFIVLQNPAVKPKNTTEKTVTSTVNSALDINESAPIKKIAEKPVQKSAKKKKVKPVTLVQKQKPEEQGIESAETRHAEIANVLKNNKSGLTLEQISGLISNDPADTRIFLKQMIDQGIIEKVQNRYYIL